MQDSSASRVCGAHVIFFPPCHQCQQELHRAARAAGNFHSQFRFLKPSPVGFGGKSEAFVAGKGKVSSETERLPVCQTLQSCPPAPSVVQIPRGAASAERPGGFCPTCPLLERFHQTQGDTGVSG